MNVACALLAAGSGKRFGGDKRMHPIDGVAMIERALRVYGAAAFERRVLVTRTGDGEIASLGAAYGFAAAENPLAAQGIGTSVAAAVRKLLSDGAPPDGILFAVADQPYLTAATVERLTERFCAEKDCIVAPCFGNRRGNPVLFPSDMFGELAALSGDVGGSAVIRRHPDRLRLCSVADGRELHDIDFYQEVRP